MGRTIHVINETPSSIHLLSLSLLLACMAAVIVVSSAMCGTWSRKKRNKAREDDNNNKSDDDALPSPQDLLETLGSTSTYDFVTPKTPTTPAEGDAVNKPLPPPPAAIAVDSGPLFPKKKRKPNIDKSSSLQHYISNKPSRRKLSAGSISLRMHGGLSMKHKEKDRGDDHLRNMIRTHREESLWTKKILLGEKCKSHQEDEEATFSHGIEEKGKQIYSSDDGVAMSRSDSFDEDTTLSFGERSFKEDGERSSGVILEQV